VVAASVTQIWRYPVKSLQGEPLNETPITDVIPGDRTWGIISKQTGRLMSAKRYGALLFGSARIEGDRCVISLPGNTETASDASDVDEVLSSWLGTEVELRQPTPGSSMSIDIELDDGGEQASGFPMVHFPTQPGWFYDSTSSLHIISEATLSHLDDVIGRGAGDVRRYRPNIVVEGLTPFGEEAWCDETLTIGTATAWVKKPTDRCVLITREQPTFAASRDALKHLVASNNSNAGISAQPRSAGLVALGDSVQPA